jgi:hypothetical protein
MAAAAFRSLWVDRIKINNDTFAELRRQGVSNMDEFRDLDYSDIKDLAQSIIKMRPHVAPNANDLRFGLPAIKKAEATRIWIDTRVQTGVFIRSSRMYRRRDCRMHGMALRDQAAQVRDSARTSKARAI